jgi:hypothetical protein
MRRLLVALALVAPAWADTPANRCENGATAALRQCVKQASAALGACHLAAGGPCSDREGALGPAVAGLRARVGRVCGDAGAVAAVGWGPLLDPPALEARLAEACRGEAQALSTRSFGGPHGAALTTAAGGARSCLEEAHRSSARFVDRSVKLRAKCIMRLRRGATCDVARVATRLARQHDAARTRIAARCPALETLVAVVPDDLLARAGEQADCLLATVHPSPAPFTLGCGPRAAVPVPARGTATHVILDEATWGTRCGDGSPYAFQIRLAPAGEPVENVVVFLQGGGVCVFEDDCAAVGASLLRAVDNTTLPSGGILSNDPAINPFAAWTKVFLPYCTQDIHVGGGTTSDFPSRTVHRFGARNVRGALRWVRDAIWSELDATTAVGYRADLPRVLLSGGSAGGFGVAYNYHWVLDDLRWPRTTAVPDSGLGLDNGELLGVGSLGFFVLTNDAGPIGWGSRPYLPPYCFNPACAVVPILQANTAPRLALPEQAVLNVSNQVDTTQVNTTFFASTAQWIDAARASYCANRGLTGLRWFLPAVPSHIHGIVASTPRLTTLVSDGVVMRDWLAAGIAAPATLADRVEEGTLTTSHGASPFPCPLNQGP